MPDILRVACLPHQREFLNAIDEQDLCVGLVAALGQGKSRALCWKAYQLAKINMGLNGLFVVPNYPLFRMVHKEEWPELVKELGVNLTWNGSNYAFTWPWGSKLWVRTAESPDKIAGPNLAYMVGDEPGQWRKEAFERGAGRVRHPKSRLRQTALAGTPEGLNWFADNHASPTGLFRTIWGTCWHPSMAHYPQQIVRLYGYDDSLLAAYGRGQFVPMRVGRVYGPFDRRKHCSDVVYDPKYPIVLACDFNIDHMRWEVMQVTPSEIRFLGEIATGGGTSTSDACKQFVDVWRPRHRLDVIVCGDASGTHRSTSSGTKTDYQIIREELDAAKFRNVFFKIQKANPRQKNRVAAVNYHLAGRGRRVIVDPSCHELILDFERVQWRKGLPEIDKNVDEARTHASDGAGYAIYQLARPVSLVKKKKNARRVNIHGHVATAGW